MFYPRASERPRALLPETIGLVVCVLPFILACHALVREREERTLDILLSTPRVTAGTLLAGKCGAAVVVTLAVFGLMLVIVHAVYGVYVKNGLLSATLLIVAPAAACAALSGLAVSAWTTSSLQAVMSSAVYLLAQSLVGGFLYPVSPGSGIVSALSLAFPLTAVHPALKAWAFGGAPDWWHASGWLAVLCVAYGLLARVVFRRPG
jgi:ABC-2 type transport system permease protein